MKTISLNKDMKTETFTQTLSEQFDKQEWPLVDGKIQISPEHLKESLLNLVKMVEQES